MLFACVCRLQAAQLVILKLASGKIGGGGLTHPDHRNDLRITKFTLDDALPKSIKFTLGDVLPKRNRPRGGRHRGGRPHHDLLPGNSRESRNRGIPPPPPRRPLRGGRGPLARPRNPHQHGPNRDFQPPRQHPDHRRPPPPRRPERPPHRARGRAPRPQRSEYIPVFATTHGFYGNNDDRRRDAPFLHGPNNQDSFDRFVFPPFESPIVNDEVFFKNNEQIGLPTQRHPNYIDANRPLEGQRQYVNQIQNQPVAEDQVQVQIQVEPIIHESQPNVGFEPQFQLPQDFGYGPDREYSAPAVPVVDQLYFADEDTLLKFPDIRRLSASDQDPYQAESSTRVDTKINDVDKPVYDDDYDDDYYFGDDGDDYFDDDYFEEVPENSEPTEDPANVTSTTTTDDELSAVNLSALEPEHDDGFAELDDVRSSRRKRAIVEDNFLYSYYPQLPLALRNAEIKDDDDLLVYEETVLRPSLAQPPAP